LFEEISMIAAHPRFGLQKRDLHIGGLGSGASGAPVVVIDPMMEAAGSWRHKSKTAARNTDDFVRSNPWAVLAVAAAVGLAAGYLLSQRSRP
jgi:hypothetical protein